MGFRKENATVNGFVIDNLGKVPEVGDSFSYDNLDIEVIKVDGRRAAEINLTVNPKQDEEESDSKEKDIKDENEDESDEKAKEKSKDKSKDKA